MSNATETQVETVDLRDLLNKPLSDFPDLPDLPAGKHFYGKLIGIKADHSRDKKTPFFNFSVRLTDPGEDVTDVEKNAITNAGFSLADYQCGANFYLTPNAMRILRRFLSSLGFPDSASFREALSLDPETGNPTPESVEKIRGLDVLVKLPAAGDNGRVYLQNVDRIDGVKR